MTTFKLLPSALTDRPASAPLAPAAIRHDADGWHAVYAGGSEPDEQYDSLSDLLDAHELDAEDFEGEGPRFTDQEQEGDFVGARVGRLWALRQGTARMAWVGLASKSRAYSLAKRLNALPPLRRYEVCARVWDADEDFEVVLASL